MARITTSSPVGSEWYEFEVFTDDSILGMRVLEGFPYPTLEEAQAEWRRQIELGNQPRPIYKYLKASEYTVRKIDGPFT